MDEATSETTAVDSADGDDANDAPSKLFVQLLTPWQTAWSDEATFCLLPGAAGEIGVLSGHAPTATLLTDGIMRITDIEGDSHRFVVSDGVAVIDQEGIRAFTEAAKRLPQEDRL